MKIYRIGDMVVIDGEGESVPAMEIEVDAGVEVMDCRLENEEG